MKNESMPGAMWAFLFYGLLMGPPLAVVCLVMCVAQLRDLGVLATQLVLEGSVSRAQGEVRSPMGAPVAAWFGAVRSTVKAGKSSTRSTLCNLAVFDGWAIAGKPLVLNTPVAIDEGIELSSSLRAPRVDVVTGEMAQTEAIPREVVERCQLRPKREKETLTWVEHRFPIGAHATFVEQPGKGRIVAIGTRRDLVERLIAVDLWMAAGLTLLMMFFSFVASGYVVARAKKRIVEGA